MKPILVTLLLAGLTLGMAGCGGSGNGSSNRQTITVVEQNSTASSTTTSAATTATTSTAKKTQIRRPHKAHTSTAPTSKPATRAKSAKYSYPIIKTKPTHDAASDCLRRAGLARIGVVRANEWAGTDRLRIKPVFVDGPYKSRKIAARAAASLEGVETAQSGGLYVVSALLTSDVQADVTLVASCLSHAPEVKTNGSAMSF
jgi:hypothetical protein